ncbi:MAG: GyrI-like domain-containing protein [Proteobacteria bacterium]|nr:GyrI-like domain-containing protein [Burkholderiales bacterium]
MPGKIDLKRDERQYYSAPTDRFVEVDVPQMSFFQIDGAGSPESEAYARAVEALYALSYPVKFASKNLLGRDYVVCPLEGLWWSDRLQSFADRDKDEWLWTMMIRQPEWVTAELVDSVREKATAKAAAVADVRLTGFTEGLSVQILHLGSFEDETPTIARLHDEYLPANGLAETGHHHEIYFSDPRTSAPDKLRTLIRQPVTRG